MKKSLIALSIMVSFGVHAHTASERLTHGDHNHSFDMSEYNVVSSGNYDATKNGVEFVNPSYSAEQQSYIPLAANASDKLAGSFPEIIWRGEPLFTPKYSKENMEKAIAEGKIHPELAAMEEAMTNPVIFKLSERMYNAFGFEGASITFIQGDEGLIIADAGSTAETAAAMLQAYREATGDTREVHTIYYTHHHPDQWAGTEGLASREDFEAGKINVIAHADFQRKMNEESGVYLNQQSIRTAYAFGAFIQHDNEYDKGVNQGVGYPADIVMQSKNKSFFAPNILVDDLLIVKIDGLTLEFFHTPGEAPDGIGLYIHETGDMVGGDTIQGETIPNLYTIRGAEYRDGLEWADSIDRMRRYHPVSLSLHHGRSAVGTERVEDVMKAYADSLRYMQDQTVRLINKGYTMHELSDRVRLPEELKDHDYLRPLRGSEYQNVANIYAGNVGWFNGDASEFAKPSHKDMAKLYVDMMGGADSIKMTAKSLIEQEKYGEAMQILTHVIRVDHSDMDAREQKSVALERWGWEQSTPGWRHWALTGAAELRGELDGVLDTMNFFGDASKFVDAPTNDVMSLIPTRLIAEQLKSNESITINMSVDGSRYLVNVSNRTMAIDSGFSSAQADLTVEMSKTDLVHLFLVKDIDVVDSSAKAIKGDLRTLQRLVDLVDTFSPFYLHLR
ncbi:alkyl sulfatase dimerization domain-containing protein [Echinimonas agarilytica]|uniref:MBL fold metallo-hydrolase n=1 Tax=Echinimonas agarilytica TaxID=1215918 RepID=A0AA41W3L2_9GAMM|nr:alkyl sulfatase dimerization domain-containing protein [Echinimonas agarilytica]MCM2678169.1 MBL fold metallo-hydrolase [Echinimonas agarilytica]